MSESLDSGRLADKAGFFLCLARAFATPAEASFGAFRDALADDLAALAKGAGYDCTAVLIDYRRAIAAMPDAQQLLVTYSRLFLMPGEKHPGLNVAAYIDGAVGGGSVRALETCYARCGLEKQVELHDLPDHVSVQLEFLAYLHAMEAEGGTMPPVRATEFVDSFVACWVSAFRADIEAAANRFGLGSDPYGPLARVLEAAIAGEAQALRAEQPEPVSTVDPEIARLRSHFAGRQMDESDLAVIREKLQSEGLPVGHIAIPIEERDRVMGFASLTPPEPKPRKALFS